MDQMNIIRVPRALEGLEPLTLDMTDIRRADARQVEVAHTNASRAPELLMTFNMAYLNVSRYLTILQFEYDTAERKLDEARAVFLIDKLPALLVEKNMARASSPMGSEDIREAFLAREPEIQRYRELLDNLRAHLGLLETMKKGFENSYNSVKKLLGSGDGTYRPNPNLPTNYNPSPQQPTNYQAPVESSDDFFGSPK